MSEGIITTTLTPEEGTTYLEVADLREGTERYPSLWVKGGAGVQVSDLEVAQMISDASALIDRMTGDHFLPTTGTLVIDGPGTDGFGRARRIVMSPRRLRGVTAVSSIASDGTTLTAYAVTGYRVHSSLTDPDIADTPVLLANRGWDGIEFLYGPGDDSLTLPSGDWVGSSYSNWPRSVAIAGTFDWPAVPEAIKHATAWLVLDWARGRQTPPRTSNFNSGKAQIEVNREGVTGIDQVDRVMRQYRRSPSALAAV